MDKQNFNETDEPWKCFHAFKTMRERNEFTDVVLVCDGGEVAAHQVVLAVRSEYFRKMFLSNFKESTTKKVEFPDINKDTLLVVLDYIYFNSIENISDQNVEHLIEIYQVSHLFEIFGLSKSCWKLILNRIHAENWFNVWELVLLHGNEEEILKILKFISDNLSDIVERNISLLDYSQLMTLLEKMNENNLPVEENFLDAIIQWKKKTKEENVDLQKIFVEIKFDFISKEFVNNLLEKEKDLFQDTFFTFFKRHFIPTLKTYSEIETLKKTFSLTMTENEKIPLKFFSFNFCRNEVNDRYTSVTIFDGETQFAPTILHNLPFLYGDGIYPIQYRSDIYIVGGTPNDVPEVTHSGVKHFFLYDWKRNEIVVKPSLIYQVQSPVTCVSEDNIYVVGDFVEQDQWKTVIQYFSMTENQWFAEIHSDIGIRACASIKNVTYLFGLKDDKICCLYAIKQLNCKFHSYIPVQKYSHFYQRSIIAHKDKIFLLTPDYEWCIFHHYSQHWTVGSISNPPSVHLSDIHIFSDANNSLMIYNDKEQSVYQLDENNSNIKKVMTLENNNSFDSQGYSKCIKWFVFQS